MGLEKNCLARRKRENAGIHADSLALLFWKLWWTDILSWWNSQTGVPGKTFRWRTQTWMFASLSSSLSVCVFVCGCVCVCSTLQYLSSLRVDFIPTFPLTCLLVRLYASIVLCVQTLKVRHFSCYYSEISEVSVYVSPCVNNWGIHTFQIQLW